MEPRTGTVSIPRWDYAVEGEMMDAVAAGAGTGFRDTTLGKVTNAAIPTAVGGLAMGAFMGGLMRHEGLSVALAGAAMGAVAGGIGGVGQDHIGAAATSALAIGLPTAAFFKWGAGAAGMNGLAILTVGVPLAVGATAGAIAGKFND